MRFFDRSFVMAGLLAGFLACLGAVPQAQRQALAVHRPHELLVRFEANVSDARRAAILRGVDGKELYRYSLVPDLVHVGVKQDVETALQVLRKDQGVRYAHANYLLFPVAETFPPDEGFPKQWGLWVDSPYSSFLGWLWTFYWRFRRADIDAPRAWSVNTGSGDFIVAVIDTGLDNSKTEFDGNLWEKDGDIGRNFLEDPPESVTTDATGHGTRIAGIIGARSNAGMAHSMVGVNWNVQIMPLQFIGYRPDDLTADGDIALAIKAIEFSADEGALVSNNSYGARKISDADSLKDAIEYAGDKGQLFVCAAGNHGEDIDVDPFYPASFNSDLDNMIVVTSIDSRRNLAIGVSYGEETVDIAAPGTDIYSVYAYDWGSDSGTSYATAFVSGAAALYWDLYPELTYLEVKEDLLNSCMRSSYLDGKVKNRRHLNVGNLVVGPWLGMIAVPIDALFLPPVGVVIPPPVY